MSPEHFQPEVDDDQMQTSISVKTDQSSVSYYDILKATKIIAEQLKKVNELLLIMIITK